MKNLNQTAEELFSKIRGRYPGVTIGDEEGNVTQDPQQARFFEFPFQEGQSKKISISLSEDGGIVIMHNKSVAEDEISKSSWYEFLKEIRGFAKKRMLNFEVRDITKSNLEKRDYKYLAKRAKESNMNESKLYGTSRLSYQDIDNARLVIKHTESVNTELASGRTQKIGKLYIESADGERFMYPYKHLSGARAMARHVSEGGVPFDDFGKHITGLSEELSKLRKFKTYMGRSSVMAESLAGYMDIVKERIQTVKKTVEHLQRPNYYREAFDSFEAPIFEEVPDDVKENWIDELTIKQFNEELADVFPYIYKLVKEGTRARELGPDDLEEAGKMKGGGDDPCWKGYKMVGTKKKGGKKVPNCVPEEIDLEQGFEEMMGQFSEDDKGAKKSDIPAALRKAKSKKDWKLSTKDLDKEKERNISSSDWLKKQQVEGTEQSVSEDLGSFKSAGIPDEYSKNLLRTINIDNDVQIDKIDGVPKAKDFNSGIVINVLPNGNVVSMLKTKSRIERGDVYFRIAYTNGEFERELKPNVKSATQGMSKRGEFYLIDKRWWDYTTRGEKPSTDPADVKSRTTADPLGGSDEDIYSYMNDTFMPKMKQQMESMIGDIYANLRKLDKDKTRYGTRLDNVQRNQREEALQAATAIEQIADEGFTRSTMEEFLRLGGKLHRGWGSIPNNERELRNLLKDDPMSRAKWAKTILGTAKKYHQSVKDMLAQSTESADSVTDGQLPLSEFILSYFDRDNGQFPKGETAVLTMVEKDYGEEFIEPAKAFIEQVNNLVAERYGYKENNQIDDELGRIKGLAGL